MTKKRNTPNPTPAAATPSEIATMVTLADELREVISEARALQKDLAAERRETRALLDRLVAERERVEELFKNAPDIGKAVIGEQVQDGMVELEQHMVKAMDTNVRRIADKLDDVTHDLIQRRRSSVGMPTLNEVLQYELGVQPGVPVEIVLRDEQNP